MRKENKREAKKYKNDNRTEEFCRREEQKRTLQPLERRLPQLEVNQPVWLEACTNPDKLQLGTSMLQSIKTH